MNLREWSAVSCINPSGNLRESVGLVSQANLIHSTNMTLGCFTHVLLYVWPQVWGTGPSSTIAFFIICMVSTAVFLRMILYWTFCGLVGGARPFAEVTCRGGNLQFLDSSDNQSLRHMLSYDVCSKWRCCRVTAALEHLHETLKLSENSSISR